MPKFIVYGAKSYAVTIEADTADAPVNRSVGRRSSVVGRLVDWSVDKIL